MIQWSWRDSPSGGSTCSFHWAQRPLLVNEPSFSIQWVAGSMKTSVWTDFGSIPGACQNSELVVANASMTQSHFSLPRACSTWLESGPMLVAVMPDSIRPSILPLSAWSKMVSQEALDAGLGRRSIANSLSLVAASPYHALSRLTRNLR